MDSKEFWTQVDKEIEKRSKQAIKMENKKNPSLRDTVNMIAYKRKHNLYGGHAFGILNYTNHYQNILKLLDVKILTYCSINTTVYANTIFDTKKGKKEIIETLKKEYPELMK